MEYSRTWEAFWNYPSVYSPSIFAPRKEETHRTGKLVSSRFKKTHQSSPIKTPHSPTQTPQKSNRRIPIMSISKTLVGFCLISCLSLISARTIDSDNLTAYEMLEKYNFPRGILPQGVKSYTLNQDGSFEVFLNGNCKFDVEGGYTLNYKSRITGKVSFGSLKELQGVSVKVLFLWLSISEVNRGNGKLDFYVGPISASFELVNFEESPQCGCGFNCGNLLSDS